MKKKKYTKKKIVQITYLQQQEILQTPTNSTYLLINIKSAKDNPTQIY
jgi:hypothetical protein